jgi:thioredoxin-like negative regulator of GroEL
MGRTAWLGLIGMVLLSAAGCSSVKWESNMEKGLKRALATNNRALVMFYSPLSSESQGMEEVFEDPEVQQVMGNFMLIRQDVNLHRERADEFGVSVTPTFIIMRPARNGMRVVDQRAGTMDTNTFRLFLIKGSLY